MTELCSVCNKDISTLPEEGCEQCGQTFDPLMPDNNIPLDFSQEVDTTYVPDTDDDWAGEDLSELKES